MAHDDHPQARAPSRARTWPVGGARPFAGAVRPQSGFLIGAQLRKWAAEEIAAGRLLPWLAVSFGFGIVLYFTADREPLWWAPSALAVICGAGAVLLRRQTAAFVLALGLCATAAGFAAATIHTARIAHPVLRFPGIMAQTWRLRHNTAPLRSANGLRPTPMAVMPAIRGSAPVSPAIRPAASASSAMARWSVMRCRPPRSRRIAGGRS